MGRHKSADRTNLNKIISVLLKNPDGLWIREISRRTGLKPTSVVYHIEQNPFLFEDQTAEGPKKPVFRLIRLRRGAISKPGMILSKILNEHEKG